MESAEIIEFLIEQAEQAKNWRSVGDRLRGQIGDDLNHPLLPLVFAFQYFFVEDSQEEYKAKYGDYAPFIELADGRVFPPPLVSLLDEVWENWSAIAQSTDHPVISSRLGDLLWLKRWGDKPYSYALQAIDGYMRIAETRLDWEELDRASCLIRGLELAIQINDLGRARDLVQRVSDNCSQSIHAPELKPGITIRLLDSLLSLKRSLQPNNLAQILEKCLQAYSDDVRISEEILIRQARFVGEGEARTSIYRRQLELWLTEAERSIGFMQVVNLEHALELARNYGFTETVEEIRRRIQEIPEKSFEFKEFSVTAQIEAEKIEKYIRAFIDLSDWRKSFSRFGSYGPPSGKYEQNLQELEKQVKEAPLQFLVSNTIYDDNNIPIKHGNTFEENKELVLVRNEVMSIQFFAELAPEILSRICETNGIPTTQAMAEYFTTSIIPSEIAENIALSFDWYFRGEFDVSAHLIIPRLEAVLRIITQKVGITIVREPIGNKAGGVLTLAELLGGLNSHIDESWRRYLTTLLVNPIGLNLRNRVCHGLMNNVDRRSAALLLHTACFLRLIEIKQKTE